LFIFSSFVCCAAEAVSVADFVVDKVPELVEGSFSGEHAIRVHAEATTSAAFKNLDFMIYLLFKNSTHLVMSAQADILRFPPSRE
jgi:hypothetical protein